MLSAGCTLFAVLVFGATLGAGVPPERAADKIMDASRKWSNAGTAVTEHTAAFLARAMFERAGVLIGFEASAEPVPTDPRSTLPDVSGLSVRSVCDLLVRLDPRYEWREVGDVIVIRPAISWRAPKHPLHRRVTGFDQPHTDVATMIDAVHDLLHDRQPGQTAPMSGVLIDEPIFSVSVSRGTIYDLLNATAEAHGALMWEIQWGRLQPDKPRLILRHRRGGAIGWVGAWPTDNSK